MHPFVKWVGGKRQLLPVIQQNLPAKYNKYYEPFVGGGALLFEIAPQTAVINDINSELIHVYKTIQQSPRELINFILNLDKTKCDEQLYLEFRKRYNQKIQQKEYDVELSGLFIWLNKHCFNGLYRVNKKGEFNVPYNGKDVVQTILTQNILEISQFLQSVVILNNDFGEALPNVEPCDFIFIDSPYDNSFTDYSKSGFLEEDHRRLASLFNELSNMGCYCMLTNHNTSLIQNLYKDFNIQGINVRRSINRDGTNRHGKELIITNY